MSHSTELHRVCAQWKTIIFHFFDTFFSQYPPIWEPEQKWQQRRGNRWSAPCWASPIPSDDRWSSLMSINRLYWFGDNALDYSEQRISIQAWLVVYTHTHAHPHNNINSTKQKLDFTWWIKLQLLFSNVQTIEQAFTFSSTSFFHSKSTGYYFKLSPHNKSSNHQVKKKR